MSDVVIRVEKLSKKYALKRRAATTGDGLRHALQEAVAAPLRKLRAAFSGTLHSGREAEAQNHAPDEFYALRDVSFEVKRGEVLGVIGRNGAGKSTLLKILSRITEPTTGRIGIKGRVASLLEVGTGFHPELSGRQNVFLNGAILGMRRAEVKRQFDEIVDFSGVEEFIDTPVKRYSSGMYVRLAFAVAAHLNPEILIVDEVLAVGDAEFQQKCLGKMRDVSQRQERTVLFVSHNLASVSSLCSSGILLANGQMEMGGATAKVLGRYLATSAGRYFVPESGPIQHAEIAQHGDALELTVAWKTDFTLPVPHLGFKFFDAFRNPIFASNPTLDGVPAGGVQREGMIKVRITQPKVLDGSFTMSLYFGDGRKDFAHYPHCLAIEIRDMTRSTMPSKAEVGSIFPECAWEFLPAKAVAGEVR